MMSQPAQEARKTAPVGVRVEHDDLDRLTRIAAAQNRARSELMTEAIEHWLLLHEHGIEVPRLIKMLSHVQHREMETIKADAEVALENLERARTRLLALELREPPGIL